ncbi:MAG: DUF799 family lipoprotein [Proteobacteria bacterium]|nr:DUF799 family lipoprotein [Pseudomonadota bacterium]
MSTVKGNSPSCRAWKNFIPFYTVLLFSLASCSGLQLKPDPSNPIRRIAVLPLYNKTAQKNGAEHVRRELLEKLDTLYYEVLPLEKTDETLRANGLPSSGIDFKRSNLEKLKKAFNVEGLVFGTLLNYDVHQRGTARIKKVAGQFWLVDLTKREDVWYSSMGVNSESLIEGYSSLADMSMNTQGEVKSSEMLPVAKGEIPIGANSFDQRASPAGFEENRRYGLPKWVHSDFCSGQLRKSFFEEDIKNKLSCEVDELIDNVTWTFPAGPGIESKLDRKEKK